MFIVLSHQPHTLRSERYLFPGLSERPLLFREPPPPAQLSHPHQSSHCATHQPTHTTTNTSPHFTLTAGKPPKQCLDMKLLTETETNGSLLSVERHEPQLFSDGGSQQTCSRTKYTDQCYATIQKTAPKCHYKLKRHFQIILPI